MAKFKQCYIDASFIIGYQTKCINPKPKPPLVLDSSRGKTRPARYPYSEKLQNSGLYIYVYTLKAWLL